MVHVPYGTAHFEESLLPPACAEHSALGETIAIRRKIRQIGRYIEKIETVFRLPKGFGWENQFSGGLRKHDHIPAWEGLIWLLLFLGNLAGLIIVVTGH